MRKELVDGILSPTKTKPHRVSTKEHNKAPKKLNIKAKVNVQCDELALGVLRLAKEGNLCNNANTAIQPPYEGPRAMLNVNGTWITSNLREHLLQVSHKPIIERYYNRRFD